MKIATSILSANDRKKCIDELNNTSTDLIHIDVMDNKFVPNYQMPINEVNELGLYTKKPFDIHLMMEDPITFIDKLDVKNTNSITIHLEIDKDLNKIIDTIKARGYLAGLAVKPNTDLKLIEPYINKIDKVIIMSVEPGFGGQKFIEDSINRVKEIRKKRNDIIIEIDGGINNETINKIYNLVDIAVVGSYIVNSNNYEEAINLLKN